MPELPEVENLRRQLGAGLDLPRPVRSIEFFRKDLRFKIPPRIKKEVEGAKLLSVERRAKYLLFRFESGVMLSHLGMTGSWRQTQEALKAEGHVHDHVRMTFADGRQLIFNDPRRFGYLDWAKGDGEGSTFLKHLGPEPLSDAFTGERLFGFLRRRKAAIKVLLMDQRTVVGVGNIYASESLYRAKVRPSRPGAKVTREECERIVLSIREVLAEAIDAGGSTISDYRHTDGSSGEFQDRFRVYDRKGEACLTCGKKISSRVMGGRSTYWCAGCQS